MSKGVDVAEVCAPAETPVFTVTTSRIFLAPRVNAMFSVISVLKEALSQENASVCPINNSPSLSVSTACVLPVYLYWAEIVVFNLGNLYCSED